MDRQAVREWFECYAVDMGGELGGGGWDIRSDQLDLACEAIAQAHDAEMFALAEKHLRNKMLLAERATALQAQVTVMTVALQELRDNWWDKHYPADVFDGSSGDEGALEVVRLREVIYQALSAAPKVLFHGRDIGAIPLHLGQERVDIYICSRPPEHGQNSEQEKQLEAAGYFDIDDFDAWMGPR